MDQMQPWTIIRIGFREKGKKTSFQSELTKELVPQNTVDINKGFSEEVK